MEIVLGLLMLVLIGVIAYETSEYKKVQQLTGHLEALVASYTGAFTAVSNAISSLENKYAMTAKEHETIEEELRTLRVIVDIHNRALNLNLDLLKIGKNGNGELYS
jgi:hypothetical protein